MSAFGATTGTQSSIAPTDCNVPQAGNDGISALRWSPNANILVSSNWDGGVRCWEVQEQGGQIRALPKAQGELKFHVYLALYHILRTRWHLNNANKTSNRCFELVLIFVVVQL